VAYNGTQGIVEIGGNAGSVSAFFRNVISVKNGVQSNNPGNDLSVQGNPSNGYAYLFDHNMLEYMGLNNANGFTDGTNEILFGVVGGGSLRSIPPQ
jgi:hypothetical protein